MANASVPQLSAIIQQHPEIGKALQYLQDVHNNIAQQINVAPVGQIEPPPSHAAVNATGGGGKLDIKISDPSPAYRGAERFADVSPDSSFATFHTIHLGATHNWRGDSPVSGKAHIRTYSQYPTSGPSDYTYHPTPVDTASPAAAATQAGNAVSGYGAQFNNSVLPPKR
jgi:hypothetical protein